MREEGSVLPLVAGFLSIVILATLGTSAVISAEILGVRLQGIADAAVLAGHDASNQTGQPQKAELDESLQQFLANAPSTKRITLRSVSVKTTGQVSQVTLCATWSDQLQALNRKFAEVCRTAEAKSFFDF